jgi:hypothetical protein
MWRLDDFGDMQSYEEWVASRPIPEVYYGLVQLIIDFGLPARMHVRRSRYFAAIYLEPLVGWTWLSTEAATMKELQRGWQPHISLSKETVDERKWDRIRSRYDQVTELIRVEYVSQGAAAVLAWTGVGADIDVWDVFLEGEFAYKWTENNFGLHVSL